MTPKKSQKQELQTHVYAQYYYFNLHISTGRHLSNNVI